MDSSKTKKHESYAIGYSQNITQIFSKRSAAVQAAYLLPYLKPHFRLLDCGCGPGSITVDFAKVLYEGEVVGVDIAENQLHIAKALAKERDVKNVSFSHGNITSLPFPDHTFDIAHVNGVLCQISDPQAALSELKRVVKPGGLVAAREPDMETHLFYPDNPIILEAVGLAKKAMCALGGDYYSGRKLKKLFTQEDFIKVKVSASSDVYGGNGISLQEACLAMSNDWDEAPWGKYVLQQGWASSARIEEYKKAFDILGKDAGGVICLTWFEAIGFV